MRRSRRSPRTAGARRVPQDGPAGSPNGGAAPSPLQPRACFSRHGIRRWAGTARSSPAFGNACTCQNQSRRSGPGASGRTRSALPCRPGIRPPEGEQTGSSRSGKPCQRQRATGANFFRVPRERLLKNVPSGKDRPEKRRPSRKTRERKTEERKAEANAIPRRAGRRRSRRR
jgi:hypothetical protein